MVTAVVTKLFDEWAAKLDPIWAEGAGSGSPRDHFIGQKSRVAEALLEVTDDKSKKAKSGVVASTYKKLRPTAKKHVEAAVPGLASLLEKHAA